jgi:hypothetical protein
LLEKKLRWEIQGTQTQFLWRMHLQKYQLEDKVRRANRYDLEFVERRRENGTWIQLVQDGIE